MAALELDMSERNSGSESEIVDDQPGPSSPKKRKTQFMRKYSGAATYKSR